jgi:hypothetical protein
MIAILGARKPGYPDPSPGVPPGPVAMHASAKCNAVALKIWTGTSLKNLTIYQDKGGEDIGKDSHGWIGGLRTNHVAICITFPRFGGLIFGHVSFWATLSKAGQVDI